MIDAPSPPRGEPTRRLADRARLLWAIEALAWAVPLVIVVPAVLGAIDGLPGALPLLGTAAAVLAAAAGVLVVPQLRWRRWRWEVRTEEVDLRHGTFTEIRTLVPMARVQHVDVRRSVVAQRLGTADVVVHTAAGTTRIPALAEAAAVEVRDRIADLARAPDEL